MSNTDRAAARPDFRCRTTDQRSGGYVSHIGRRSLCGPSLIEIRQGTEKFAAAIKSPRSVRSRPLLPTTGRPNWLGRPFRCVSFTSASGRCSEIPRGPVRLRGVRSASSPKRALTVLAARCWDTARQLGKLRPGSSAAQHGKCRAVRRRLAWSTAAINHPAREGGSRYAGIGC